MERNEAFISRLVQVLTVGLESGTQRRNAKLGLCVAEDIQENVLMDFPSDFKIPSGTETSFSNFYA
ncbi:hypothetical protein E2C01_095528 [Portunus trituberculatus]|uniref:Uncharacterized protein n=1 Tax=Portunus trituberculatus TaxID=210409 RepID=A0A5B7K4F9_PORTR|nr:hypothetical protein [Portunus trituberculatus]